VAGWAGLPFVEIDIRLLTDQIGVPATDTFDLGQGVHDLLLAINIGVEETEDELKVRLLSRDESCLLRISPVSSLLTISRF
jgi:hypothetical protein